MKLKSISFLLLVTLITSTLNAQEGRSIGRKYSKKLLEQEQYFDKLKKSNGEFYGNKDVAIEMSLKKIVTVDINTNGRPVEIKPWDDTKVKINTVVYFDGKATNVNDITWLEKLNIKTRMIGNTYKINLEPISTSMNGTNNNSNTSTSNESVEVYSVDGKYIKSEPVKKQPVIIYVPKDNKIKIDIRYTDAKILNYVNSVDANVTNGNLDIEKVNELELDSRYSNVSINDVDKANIVFINGDFMIADGNNVELDTKYSTIGLGKIKNLKVNSTNDEYEAEDIYQMEVNKNYGTFRVDNLNESIQFVGTNSPLKIKKMNVNVKAIDIDNKYTDLKLPLKEIKSFAINFEGSYSTIQKSFEWNNTENRITTADSPNNIFKANLGTSSTNIKIKCQNCNVDFR